MIIHFSILTLNKGKIKIMLFATHQSPFTKMGATRYLGDLVLIYECLYSINSAWNCTVCFITHSTEHTYKHAVNPKRHIKRNMYTNNTFDHKQQIFKDLQKTNTHRRESKGKSWMITINMRLHDIILISMIKLFISIGALLLRIS